MKFFYSILLSIVIASALVFNTTYADSLVIIAEESVVGNLIYKVLDKNGNTFIDGTEFELLDSNFNVIGKTTSNGSIVVFANVPFGDYYLRVILPNGHFIFKVTIDKDYLDTQHIIKDVYVGSEFITMEELTIQYPSINVTANGNVTGLKNKSIDWLTIGIYSIQLFTFGLIILILFRIKRRSYESQN